MTSASQDSTLSPIDPDRPVGPITRFRRKFTDGLERFVDNVYQPALGVFLHNRYVVVTAFMAYEMIIPPTSW